MQFASDSERETTARHPIDYSIQFQKTKSRQHFHQMLVSFYTDYAMPDMRHAYIYPYQPDKLKK